MNRWLLAAGLLSVLTFFIHVLAGEAGFHTPALQSPLSHELKAVLSVVWHGVSVVLALNSVLLLWLARTGQGGKAALLLVLGQYGGFVALFVIYGLARHGSLLPMPQWLVFLVMTILIAMGYRSLRQGALSAREAQ